MLAARNRSTPEQVNAGFRCSAGISETVCGRDRSLSRGVRQRAQGYTRGIAILAGSMDMITIIGLSGSTRRGSLNAALLRAAASAMPVGAELRVESIATIPLYNGDDEAARGVPEPVAHLKDAIAAAAGLLLVTPEYNNSMPGVAKNAVDWLSRPPADIGRVFGRKPVAIAGASPGGFGTILAQNAWLPVFKTLGADLWSGGRLLISRAGAVIDAQGEIEDVATRESIRKFMAGFVIYVSARKGPAAP
jgi:NAD(P)H-dependent FMN reductase